MGLWDEMFAAVAENHIKLPKITDNSDLAYKCRARFEQIEAGFVEGFFGGQENLKIPAYIAEIVDSLSRLALLYNTLAKQITTEKNHKNIYEAVLECDKTAEKSIAFLIDNYVLPHIEELKRTVN